MRWLALVLLTGCDHAAATTTQGSGEVCHDFAADTAFYAGKCPHPDQKVRLQLINDDTFIVCECPRPESDRKAGPNGG